MIAFCVLFVYSVLPCCAQQPKPYQQSNEWTYSITPYIWFSSIGGDAAIRGNMFGIHERFTDLVSNVDFGFEFHFEARKNNWGCFVDPTYLKLSADTTTADGLPADVRFKEWLVEFGGVYGLPIRPTRSNCLPQNLDLLFGGRYWNLSGDLTQEGTTTSGSQSWVDPIIGLRYITGLSDKWSLLLRGDIGGFGVGSDFSWNAIAAFGYATKQNQTAFVGYRALKVDRTNGSDGDLFEWDVTYYGPEVGYQWQW